jgi:hypothetical protein
VKLALFLGGPLVALTLSFLWWKACFSLQIVLAVNGRPTPWWIHGGLFAPWVFWGILVVWWFSR